MQLNKLMMRFEATATLGKIDIKIAGDISINVASF
jgi:hypothetical protein